MAIVYLSNISFSSFFSLLVDHIFSLRNSKSLKLIEDEKSKGDTADASNDFLAVVPWVASGYWSTPRREEEAVDSLIPMEAEEVDMMDTEENSVNCNGGPTLKFDRMVEENEGLQNWQQQQQHCMMPQFIQNTHTPIRW